MSPVRNETPETARPTGKRDGRRSEGIVLAIVLVLIFVLVTAVYTFQRRAIIDTSIATNRLRGAEAEALARGGLRIGEAVVFLVRLKDEAGASGDVSDELANPVAALAAGLIPSDEIWASMGSFPLTLEGGRTLRISIEDEGSRLNLNALVPQTNGSDEDSDRSTDAGSDEDAVNYLDNVLEYIVDGIEGPADDKNYDTRAIAENILDYMDADEDARNGRPNEDDYYRNQDPPYRARNGPFLSLDEIGLVEGVDPRLLKAMGEYVTVHPIGGRLGINLNRAQPWVLSIVSSAGTSEDRGDLLDEGTVRDIWAVRQASKILCDDTGADPTRCVPLGEVGDLGNGSIYPETPLPAKPTVYRVVAEATVGDLTRRLEAVYDTRPIEGPQLLSWRRLRGSE